MPKRRPKQSEDDRMSDQTDPLSEEPYGDFIPFDPECPRIKYLENKFERKLTDDEAQRHRAICERCMLLAVLSSEIVL